MELFVAWILRILKHIFLFDSPTVVKKYILLYILMLTLSAKAPYLIVSLPGMAHTRLCGDRYHAHINFGLIVFLIQYRHNNWAQFSPAISTLCWRRQIHLTTLVLNVHRKPHSMKGYVLQPSTQHCSQTMFSSHLIARLVTGTKYTSYGAICEHTFISKYNFDTPPPTTPPSGFPPPHPH